jgi:hypothetical protein
MAQKRREEIFFAPPKFEDTKSPNFMYVYATGVFGGLDPNDGRMIFYLDRLEPETLNQPTPGAQVVKKILRESQVEVHMSPTQFKSIALWMNSHIQRYEELFGQIPMEPKQQQPPQQPSSNKMIS